MKVNIILIFLLFITFCTGRSQEVSDRKIELRIDSLENQLTSMQKKLEAKEQKDKFKELTEKAKQFSAQEKRESEDISKKFHSGERQQQGLNPNISVGGDFFTSYSSSDSKLITQPSDFSYGSNNFFMRELELGFEAPLDPFTRGKAFLSVTEDGIALEEGYMELINLPLNVNLKTGIFKAEYGLLNRYHPHALPQFDKPKVLTYHFGEPGLGGAGVAASFMFSKTLLSDANSFDFSVVDGGNGLSFTEKRDVNLLYIGHFKSYFDINDDSYFEYTLSGVAGLSDSTGNNNSYVGSLGLHYKWTPVDRAKYKTFDWKTELLYGFHERTLQDVKTFGFYSSIQNKLNARFGLGARVGYTQLPHDSNDYEIDYAVCLDFWQSEFVYFRIQYQYNDRHIDNMKGSLGIMPSDHCVTLHVSWAMGPHKHEAY